MKKIFILTAIAGTIVLSSCAAAPPSADKFTISNEFVDYIKSATNPNDFGMRGDGRFYPYSLSIGRRIGYRQPVLDKKYYSQGWSKEEAEKQLRKDLTKTLKELRKYMAKKYPAAPFDTLTRKSQEILLDYAYSQGVKNLKPIFYETVINQDWGKLFNTFMYIRWMEKGWPDTIKNKAFADRWLDPEKRKRL